MNLLRIRRSPSFGIPESLTLAIYSVVLAIATFKHEPWLDEAQAWLIARDCSLKDILLRHLHYEGTPGLWHVFLWLLVKAHVSYAGMHWATAAVAVITVAIFLRYSPFPPAFRFLIPFSFFLQYEFAVVARSYVLFTLTMFVVAILFSSRRSRPILFAVFCGLLANTSLFGVCTAIGFFGLYAYRFYKRKRQAATAHPSRSGMKVPAIAFLLLFFFAIYTALPTPDAKFGAAGGLNGKGHVQHLLSVLTFTQKLTVEDQPPAPPLTQTEMTLPFRQSNSFQDRLWRFLELRKNVYGPELILRKISLKVYLLLCVLTFPISNWNWIALGFLIALFLWLKKRNQLLLLIPYLFLLVFCTLVSCEPHNSGVLWITILAVLWISFSESTPETADTTYIGLCVALFLVVAVQIAWTVQTVRNDYKNNYDMGWRAASFIKALPPGRRIVGFNIACPSIQPYFARNIFENQPRSFWLWSKSRDPDSHFEQVIQSRPDLVVITDLYRGNEIVHNQWIQLERPWTMDPTVISSQQMSGSGYHLVARFCGQTYLGLGAERKICYVLFEPVSNASSSAFQHQASNN